MEKLTLRLNELIEQKEIAGVALRVRQEGDIIYDISLGYADIEKKEPVTVKSIYRLCSMTKLLVAVAIMQLVEKDRLSLDDNLLNFFPEFPLDKQRVTVRHLLNHSCGLGQGDKSMDFYEEIYDSADSLEERINKCGNMPFDFQPGESANYSPIIAFDILGRIVEIVSGLDLESYLSREICHPLGMYDTRFVLDEEQTKRRAKLYTRKSGELEEVKEENKMFDGSKGYFAGCGGLFGTLYDYDRFTTMLYHGGILDGNRILKKETIDLMTTPRQITSEEAVPGGPWGLGFMCFEKPELAGFAMKSGSFGWSGAYGTHMYVDLASKISVTMMVGREDIGGAGSFVSREVEGFVSLYT